MTLSALIALVEAATGPSREIDVAVWVLFGTNEVDAAIPEWSASIDAVVALIRREMPGESWVVDFLDDAHAIASVGRHGVTYQTPALALLLAFLRAKQAKENTL